MKTPKTICVLMNALLKVSRKWLIVIFCFFMSMPFAFAQGNTGPTTDHPYYNPEDRQWYSFWDTEFHQGRNEFTHTYDLTNCYRPFYMLSIDIVGLTNPQNSGEFGSKSDIYVKVDNQYVWLANTTGAGHAGKTWSGAVTDAQKEAGWIILNDRSDFSCSMLDYSYFHDRTATDGTRYNAKYYSSALGNNYINGYYPSNNSGDPNVDNDDVVRDFLKYFQVDYIALKDVRRDFGSARRRQTTTYANNSNHKFRDQYGDQPYARFVIDCKKNNIGLNPVAVYIGKEGTSKVGRIVMDSLRAKLAPHLALQSDDDYTLVTEKTLRYEAAAVNTSTGEEFMPFRSFLLDGSWKVILTFDEDDNQPGTAAGTAHSTSTAFEAFEIQFKNDPNPSSTSYTAITSQNTVTTLIDHTNIDGQICGYQGSVYNTATNPAYDPSQFIKVSFVADTTCTRIATLTFYDDNYYTYNTTTNKLVWKTGVADDGMPHTVTIKLSGEYKKAPELKWLANDNVIANNGTLDVTYNYNRSGETYWSNGTLALSAYPFKDSQKDTRLQGKAACPSNGAIKYCLIDNNGNECNSYNGVTIDPVTGCLAVEDVTEGFASKDDLDKAKKVLTVKVKAIIAATTECKADTSYITVNVHPKHVILTETTLNTAMCEYDLVKNGHVITNYDSPIVCYCNFETDGTVCGSYGATANAVNLHHVGKILVSAESKDSEHGDAALDYTEFTVERGTLYFESDGDWKTGVWTSKEGVNAPVIYNTIATVPLGKNHDAVINAACSVSTNNSASGSLVEGTSNWANNLTISSTGSLTINSTGCAMVEGTLTNNAGSANLSIKADENSQGSLIFAAGTPAGNVDVVCRGTDSDADPIWQYRGIPVASATVTVPSGSYIYEWSEALLENPLGWGYEHWKNSNGSLSAWKGYAFGRLNSSDEYYIYNVSGTLLCADKSVTLDYTTTNNSNNKGQNLITNSYNAAVAVSELETGDFHNTEATLFIYNQGTYNDYKDNWDGSESSVTGDESAKVTVYPIFSGADATGAEISVIPSGQSFFLRALGTGASFDFRHETLKPENAGTALRAPRRSEDFNVLEINVEGGNQKDRVVLMENNNCSRGFDNGYDGSKFLSSGMAQIYATNDFGKTEINCDAVMAGNYIGFAAAKNGVKYTLSFNTDRLEGYNKLFLYDTENGRYIDILAGETYEFTGKHSGEDRRFILMGEREDGSSFTGSERRIEVIGDNFVVCGFDGMDVPVVISDMSGRTWWQGTTADGALFNLPSLPKGVYVISVDKCNVKFAK